MKYHRIVVKLGTNLLTAGTNRLNLETMTSLVGQIATLHREGLEIVVVSSGAVTAGRQKLGLYEKRKDIPFKQVLAAVGQSRLMDAYDELFSCHEITIAQALLTRTDLSDRLGYINAHNTLSALLELRVIPIVNENDVVAVEELKHAIFGDNDSLSSLVASLVNADLLIILTDTIGLCTANPHIDPNAKLIKCVDKIDSSIKALASSNVSDRSIGGMTTKIEAAKLATTAGIAVIIADGQEPNVIDRLVKNEAIGTYFKPTASKLESRKRWLLSRLSKGTIFIDDGAAMALQRQNKSLLPAGITKVIGKFDRGDVISISRDSGEKIACGISNYNSKEIDIIKGHHSEKIMALLGDEYGTEVVHRDNLVII